MMAARAFNSALRIRIPKPFADQFLKLAGAFQLRVLLRCRPRR